ncbi:hypothetical protein LTR08_005838 [Meristemomyces frigidus]|nr:hypothetical protein LTR08_005838 [Meristemomyces frigidus]
MDRSALARNRKPDDPLPAKHTRDKRTQQQETLRRPNIGKIRAAKDSYEITRVPRRCEAWERPDTGASTRAEADANARHFTVGNVGAGGLLYLKPSHLPPVDFRQAPATPPATAEWVESVRTEWPSARQSNASGTWTPRLPALQSGTLGQSIAKPPLSLANGSARRRSRSHSFSTPGERPRPATLASNDFQLLVNGSDAVQRPKSSVDLTGGLLNLHIPHYRLGTPRFSDRGTAYLHNSLHNSMYTLTPSEDMRSSTFSRVDYDKIFPAPPGQSHSVNVTPARNTPSPFLHPAAARASETPSRTSPTPTAGTPPNQNGGATLSVFDHVEANPNDPSIVRYHAATGKIVAATPARLIAQITSPMFLDYELLSDFFLTFRSFMSCGELLEYLMARMKWALGTDTDAGRIVRVRTFVALRHWVLNYFADDFVLDLALRQRFCGLINGIAQTLYNRPDHGGSDMNIVGEMRKCWRRTCAMFWPVTDALDSSPEADIVPGGDQSNHGALAASTANLPLVLQPKRSKADFRRVSVQLQIPAERQPERPWQPTTGVQSTPRAFDPESVIMRKASLPTSPMSVESFQVLSCSVPFLRHIRPSEKVAQRPGMARPVGPQRNPPLSGKPNKPLPTQHQHKRGGSFSDALRDGRAPLPFTAGQPVDILSLPAVTFTGDLVRGLLLQPSPATVDLLVPISPDGGPRAVRFGGIDENYFDDRSGQNIGVKRLVGDVRRALSSRKGRHESPTSSHRSGDSSDSRGSAHLAGTEYARGHQRSAWQHLRGPSRVDVLGARVGDSYKKAFYDADLPDPADEEAHRRLMLDRQHKHESEVAPDQLVVDRQHQRETEVPTEPDEEARRQLVVDRQQQREGVVPTDDLDMSPPRPNLDRWNSRVTTGDRSILIMDDTGAFDLPPMMSRALPSVSSVSSSMAPEPLFRNPEGTFKNLQHQHHGPGRRSVRQSVSFAGEKMYSRRSSHMPLQELLPVMQAWTSEQPAAGDDSLSPTAPEFARKSSTAEPAGLHIQPPHQLRRRPGGNLKDADHVHELAPLPRPHSAGSFSTFSLSQPTSTVHSREMSGLKFSGQDFASWRMPSRVTSDVRRTSVGLLDWESGQPNLRPSFQAEVSQLARLSDRSITGGIEDTLMKLEGKAVTSTGDSSAGAVYDAQDAGKHKSDFGTLRIVDASFPSADEGHVLSPTRTETQGASIYHLSASDATDDFRLHSIESSELYGRSETQDSAAPVLPSSSKAMSFPIREVKSPALSKKSTGFTGRIATPVEDAKGDRLNRTDSRAKSSTQGSFLLDDNESLSDISTEMADMPENEGLGVRSFFFDDTVDDDDDDVSLHAFRPPPTPPSTGGALPDNSPERQNVRTHAVPAHLRFELKETQSAPKLMSPNLDGKHVQQHPLPPAELRRIKTAPKPQPTAHLPFLMAFESDVIAEQLTIIEKDALDEVDWKDLINLNWQQSPTHVRNWVEFLKADNYTGIDIVVARFNLVVKWVVSECLLTEVPSERARCITKFVHIAMHCRRFRNYASAYQITLGLLSADLARLHMTWTLVAPVDKQKLEQLDKLCQPVRNFANLRQEMEGSSVDSGCIPFIGLYTHDLIYNAQKPSRIESAPPNREPLINFERYQTAATIVKGLLRLIEASSKYVFHPHPEVLSRCLWLAALEDTEISSRSKTLER